MLQVKAWIPREDRTGSKLDSVEALVTALRGASYRLCVTPAILKISPDSIIEDLVDHRQPSAGKLSTNGNSASYISFALSSVTVNQFLAPISQVFHHRT